MQTSKSIAEMGCHYEGKLISPTECSTWNIYKSRGKWYVPALRVDLKKRYPTIHDTVLFTENNEPVYEVLDSESPQKFIYHPISEGTAQVLMRKDGYVNLGDLTEEIKSNPGAWVESLDKPASYAVRAHIEYPQDTQQRLIAGTRTPTELPVINRALQGIDLLLVDVPGTIIYNVAIPFMSPFKFFSEFNLNY